MKSRSLINFFFAFTMLFFGAGFITTDGGFSGYAHANIIDAENAAKKEESCGISSSGDVISRNYSICKEDISYNVLYMSFSKIFNEFPILKAFTYDINPVLDDKGYSSSMGGSTIAIISGFSYLVLFAGLLLVSYATIKVLYLSSQSGSFLTGSLNKRWMIIRSIAILIAIFPIGTISLSQLLVLCVAIFSIMGGNFFHSTFISNLQQESISIEPDDGSLEDLSIDYSNTLITANLCQIRTTKSLLHNKFFDNQKKSFKKRTEILSSCVKPEGKFSFLAGYQILAEGHSGSLLDFDLRKSQFKTGNITSLKFTNVGTCGGVFSDYEEEEHGSNYSCGEMRFSPPNMKIDAKADNKHKSETIEGGWFTSARKEYMKIIDDAVIKTYNTYKFEAKFKEYENLIKDSGGNFNFGDALESSIKTLSAQLIADGGGIYNRTISEYSNSIAMSNLYMYMNLINANLLGARSENAEVQEQQNIIPIYNLIGGYYEAKKQLNNKYEFKEQDSATLITKQTEYAAFLLDEFHCVSNFLKLQEATKKSYDSMVEYKSSSFSTFSKRGSYSGECLWLSDTSKNPVKMAGNSTIHPITKEVSFHVTGGNLSDKFLNYETSDVEGIKELVDAESVRLILEAQDKRLVVAAHYYVVSSSIRKAYQEILKEVSDKSLPANMRKKGWGSLGGLILSITKNQVDASAYMTRINDSVTFSSDFQGSGDGYYINSEAYGDKFTSLNPQSSFRTMNLKNFFSSHNTTDLYDDTLSDSGSSEEENASTAVKRITRYIESALTHPMRYLKNMGGLDKNLTIREGVEKCYKEGNCKTGDMHPVTALVYMGNDLMDFAITFFIAQGIFNGLKWALNSLDDSASDGGGITGIASTLIPPLKILLKGGKYVVNAVSAILNTLSPIVFMLFLLGLFFGYLLPLMPYMIYLMQFIGWLVLIYTLLFSVQIWLMMIFVPSSTGEPRGDVNLIWQYIGQLIFKPAFIVIGLILGWYMSSVLIYVVNMTFFGVISALSEISSGPIRAVIDIIMFYVTYLIIIIVVLKYSFQLISSFPDLASKAINLRDGTDPNAKSAATDRLLTAAVMHQMVKQTVSGVGGKLSNEVKSRVDKKNKDDRDDRNLSTLVDDKFNNRFGKNDDDGEKLSTPSDNAAKGADEAKWPENKSKVTVGQSAIDNYNNANSQNASTPNSGNPDRIEGVEYVPNFDGGKTPPSGGGNTQPIGGGNTPPSGGGNTPPSGGGNTPPSGGGNTPPSGGGNTPPSGGGNTPPSGGGNTES